jgi:hypothetical protein
MPFGLKTAHWDEKAPTGEELDTMKKHLDAVMEGNVPHIIVLHAHWKALHVPADFLERHDYKVSPVVWHKTDQNVVGDPTDLTFSWETFVIGIKKSNNKADNRSNLSRNPTQRHNYVEGPVIHTMRKDATGQPINPHEKPDYVSAWVADRWTVPHDWVIVVGGGAGGDARGFVRSGCNVVILENDPIQCRDLEKQFATLWAKDEEDAKAKEAAELKAKEIELPQVEEVEDDVPKGPCTTCGCTSEKRTSMICTNCALACCSMCILDLRTVEDGEDALIDNVDFAMHNRACWDAYCAKMNATEVILLFVRLLLTTPVELICLFAYT